MHPMQAVWEHAHDVESQSSALHPQQYTSLQMPCRLMLHSLG